MTNDIILADQLVYRDDSDRPMTTSIIVAAKFGKRHDNVLQAIERLECSAEFTALNFQVSGYEDSTGRSLPLVRMTRDGFAFLVMGFTGAPAARWKEAFLAAFNALEANALEMDRTLGKVMAHVASALETNAKTQALCNSQTWAGLGNICDKVDKVDAKVDRLTEVVTSFAEHANQHRRRISEPTKQLHRDVLARRGWSCPCCNRVQGAADFEFDHFFANSLADFDHSWPLCRPCHSILTIGQRPRSDVRSDFDAYQAFAKRELPRQSPLF